MSGTPRRVAVPLLEGQQVQLHQPLPWLDLANTGKLLKVKDQTPDAGYPPSFNCEGSHDMKKLGAFESYRGFLFGSVNPEVQPLSEHLGEATKIIDTIVDQAPEGIEVLRGASTYTFDGNWKLTAENGADGYHAARLTPRGAAGRASKVAGSSSLSPVDGLVVSWSRRLFMRHR